MKLILQKDIKNIGKKGSIVEFADGYAINYLIPNKLAIMADGKNTKILANENKNQEEKRNAEHKKEDDILMKINNKEIVLTENATKEGNLFKSINTKNLIEILKKEERDFGEIKIKEENIEPNITIKNTGKFEFSISNNRVKANFTLTVNKK